MKNERPILHKLQNLREKWKCEQVGRYSIFLKNLNVAIIYSVINLKFLKNFSSS